MAAQCADQFTLLRTRHRFTAMGAQARKQQPQHHQHGLDAGEEVARKLDADRLHYSYRLTWYAVFCGEWNHGPSGLDALLCQCQPLPRPAAVDVGPSASACKPSFIQSSTSCLHARARACACQTLGPPPTQLASIESLRARTPMCRPTAATPRPSILAQACWAPSSTSLGAMTLAPQASVLGPAQQPCKRAAHQR